MKGVSGQDTGFVEGLHVSVRDTDAAGIGAGVEFGVHGQASRGGDCPDGFDDDLV